MRQTADEQNAGLAIGSPEWLDLKRPNPAPRPLVGKCEECGAEGVQLKYIEEPDRGLDAWVCDDDAAWRGVLDLRRIRGS